MRSMPQEWQWLAWISNCSLRKHQQTSISWLCRNSEVQQEYTVEWGCLVVASLNLQIFPVPQKNVCNSRSLYSSESLCSINCSLTENLLFNVVSAVSIGVLVWRLHCGTLLQSGEVGATQLGELTDPVVSWSDRVAVRHKASRGLPSHLLYS